MFVECICVVYTFHARYDAEAWPWASCWFEASWARYDERLAWFEALAMRGMRSLKCFGLVAPSEHAFASCQVKTTRDHLSMWFVHDDICCSNMFVVVSCGLVFTCVCCCLFCQCDVMMFSCKYVCYCLLCWVDIICMFVVQVVWHQLLLPSPSFVPATSPCLAAGLCDLVMFIIK